MKQLGLFLDSASPPPSQLEDDRQLVARLPADILLGPSTWTFPGWAGIVYPSAVSREDLVDRGLQHAARYPLFRTVGIDRSHYAPMTEGELHHYAEQLPPGFPCIIKAWNAITTYADPRTSDLNPGFFDAATCERHVLVPLARAFESHVGALVFQIAPIPPRALPHPDAFAERLDRFLGTLPTAFRYAVEVRNRELLTSSYLGVLARHGASHVLNLWERMPGIGKQLAVPGVLTAPFVVCRLSIPPGNRYDDRKRDFSPFDRIVTPDETMRSDVEELVRACIGLRKTLFLTVNNKVEGSSPLTIRALIERVVAG